MPQQSCDQIDPSVPVEMLVAVEGDICDVQLEDANP